MSCRNYKYVVLDVELIDTNTWLSMAFVTAEYPSGKIISVEEFYVDRTKHEIQNNAKKAFWARNVAALHYNLKRGSGIPEIIAENRICDYLVELRQRTPYFFLVSDNPSMDIAIVDSILNKHGHEPLSQRTPEAYVQVLCTWSYQQSLSRMFNTKTCHLFQHPGICRLLALHKMSEERALERIAKNATNSKQQHQPHLLPHTPYRDCCRILATFFRCLDVTMALSSLLQNLLAERPSQQQQPSLPFFYYSYPPPLYYHVPYRSYPLPLQQQ